MSAKLETREKHFCMDRFEYPNKKGQFPIIYTTYPESKAMCEEQGKRLCSEEEWTFACEGEEATPYPYGYVRDPSACAIDAKWRAFNERAMQPRDGYEAMAEMDRLWQGHASGAMARCRSAAGLRRPIRRRSSITRRPSTGISVGPILPRHQAIRRPTLTRRSTSRLRSAHCFRFSAALRRDARRRTAGFLGQD